MTKSEYADYVERVNQFFSREGIDNLSTMYDEDDEPIRDEFSWRPCECCRRPNSAGERYQCNGYNPTTDEVQEYEVCPDCVYFAEYGQLDDSTMWEVNHSAE